jgi:hypothetical protein
MALSSDPGQLANSTTLYEVRSIAELDVRLESHPNTLVLIETTRNNIDATLFWLAATTSQPQHPLALALLDYGIADNPASPFVDQVARNGPSDGSEIIAAALREAGATDVIHSPRQIRRVLELGQQHTAERNIDLPGRPLATQSFEDWAWSQLPWQDAVRPLG